MNQGYFSQPTISGSQIAFITDDDLWTIERSGGVARRLTANKGNILSPCFSPDGQWLAFISTDTAAEGDIYVMPAQGGEAERLTWLGVQRIINWKDNNTIRFVNGMDGYPNREAHVYELNVKTRDFSKVDLGPASYYYAGKNFQILARNSGDSARWKRYQGGTAGVLWVQKEKGKFQRILKDISTNITRPEIVGTNIYFISDHEGVGNVYVCDLAGKKLRRLTDHIDYYCRNLRSDGQMLVYQAGAEIYTYDLTTEVEEKIEIECHTTAMQSMPRYENWCRFFHGMELHPKSSELCLASRGRLFEMASFSGPVKELDVQKRIRYSYPSYNFDGTKLLAAASDTDADEALVLFDLKTDKYKTLFPQIKWGKIWGIKCSPIHEVAAIITNRKEVYIVDFKKNTSKKIETNMFNRPADLDWSADGRYLAYTANVDARRTGIRIYDTKKSKLNFLLNPIVSDFSPSFDPEGNYLYFLGIRSFAPNYNETHFDLGFPFATRPYVVALNDKVLSPFEATFKSPQIDNSVEKKSEGKSKKAKSTPTFQEIQFDGIENRVQAFELPLGGYGRISAIKNGVIYTKQNVAPIENFDRFQEPPAPDLYVYRFEEGTQEVFHKAVKAFAVNTAKTHVLLHHDVKIRLLDVKLKPSQESKVGKKDGYVDVSRIKLKVEPRLEWKQMYHEAWVLQKEHFWRSDMSKVDWNLVYKRYQKLLSRVKTRSEFSDLMWEMQGELGTSHSYEMSGQYTRVGSGVPHARLGAYFQYRATTQAFEITRILAGDSWSNADGNSPLTSMGVSLKVGDRIMAVDGIRFVQASDLYELIENKAAMKVELTVLRRGAKSEEKVVVKTNRQQKAAWYREWVDKNKKYVHEKSKGKLGYVHVPDMGAYGYSEFYRNFVNESQYEGLVVDVRYNGGGHVSQHLLKVLAQKVLGFDQTRHQGLEKYPVYAAGVLVALANEQSGSDGDIFPHSFKLMKLGKLIGKRTWGGIIGINGQYSLSDGTYVTQPEYSFWFKDNEWFVENHGVNPDIEVDITPEDYRDKKDPQLDRAITEALSDLKSNPSLKFKPSYYPDLSIPKKLARLNR